MTVALQAFALAARIDTQRTFACTSFKSGEWEVLGPAGVSIGFPIEVCEAWQVLDVADTSVRGRCSQLALALEATWRLDSDGLRVDLLVVNQTRAHAPFGIGVQVHLNAVGQRVQALAPAEEFWPRTRDGMLNGDPQPVGGVLDLRRPQWVDRSIDVLYTRRHFANLLTNAAIIDPATGREVWLTTSADFREVRVSVDPHGAGVLESATCADESVRRGLRTLAPGETWRGSAHLSARTLR